MRGYVDIVQDGSIEGWIIDEQRPYVEIVVNILVDGVIVTSGTNHFVRQDLVDAQITDGPASFVIPFDSSHHCNIPCKVTVVEASTGWIIPPGSTNIEFEGRNPTLHVGRIAQAFVSSIESLCTTSEVMELLSLLIPIFGLTVDRAVALQTRDVQALSGLRLVIQGMGGLGGMLSHLIGVISQNYEPIELPQADQPDVSIIIPVHNNFQLTYNCIKSIAAFVDGVAYEIIIVDDLSTDETILANLCFMGPIKLFRNKANLGFIKSCNEGAKRARGDKLLFLNNDTLAVDDFLSPLCAVLNSHPDVGVVGSRLLFADGSVQECGGIVWRDGSAWNWGRGADAKDPRFRFMREADYVSGAALMIRSDLFAKLFGFDEHFVPAYYEDTDLCFRVRQSGYRVFVQPSSSILHLEGQSSGTSLASGVKRYQVINHGKFLKRWRELLDSHAANGANPSREARRHSEKYVLFLDDTVLTPDSDAGSNAAFQHILSMQRLGYSVVFVPTDNMADIPPYTARLEELGVECVYAPYCWSLEEFLRKTELSFDVVYMHRFSNASKFMALIRRFCTRAAVLYNVADLHYLRLERAQTLGLPEADTHGVSKRRELDLVAEADTVIVHSAVELKIVRGERPAANVHTLAWTIETAAVIPSFNERLDIGFVGGYRHKPNIDAAKWFVQSVLPIMRQANVDLRLELIGSNMPDEIRRMASADVLPVGFVSNIEEKLSQLRVTVAPLRYGAGLKGKVLSSLACGTPCVLTSIAAEGFVLPPLLREYVADSPAQMAILVARLYKNIGDWEEASEVGINYIRNEFSEKAIDAGMCRAIASCRNAPR